MGKYTTSFFVLVIAVLVFFWVKKTWKIIAFQQENKRLQHQKTTPRSYASNLVELIPFNMSLFLGGVPVNVEPDNSLRKVFLVDIYKPVQPKKELPSRFPVLIWFNENQSPEFKEVLKALSYEGNIMIFSFPFTTNFDDEKEVLKHKYFHDFMDMAIRTSFQFECDFNQIVVGGDNYGGFISVLFSFFMKNNFKYSPGWSGQILINPNLYNIQLDPDVGVWKNFDYGKHLKDFYDDEKKPFYMRSFSDPRMYLPTVVFASKDEKENNVKWDNLENFVKIMKDAGVDYHLFQDDVTDENIFKKNEFEKIFKVWVVDEVE